jgi:6-pyruvoyltetrahydropterin/6-carboxytetrahydropterin synthase
LTAPRRPAALHAFPGGGYNDGMSESFHVRVGKDELAFSAAHFITYDGGTCERLHGHNWGVAVEVFGPLDGNSYVVDFIALRDVLKAIVGELDHRVLLPTEHPLIHVTAGEREVVATCGDLRWAFPRGDCALLPLANTTAELIARFIGRRLLDDLTRRTGRRPGRVRVAVDECLGQWGVCDLVGE